MSRELYQARAKKVQKLGRDGLVEQDRATGQERRVSQKEADVSFGPERPEPEQAVPARTQQRTRQRKQYQQEVRQAENAAIIGERESAPDGYTSGVTTIDAGFPDAPVLEGFSPDAPAPEIPNAALSMRGAVDMPMVAPPPVMESGPKVIRLRSRKPGKETDKETRTEGKEFRKDPEIPQQGQRQTDVRNRLKFDGERRISPEKAPAQPEGDAKSPSLRGADDTPLADRPSVRDSLRSPKYRSDAGGRLQFDAARKTEDKTDGRAAQKKQAARQFSTDTSESRLHFESAKPMSSGGAAANGTPLRFVPDTPAVPDLTEDTEEQQNETDAVEAAVDVAVPVMTALRRREKPKPECGSRQKYGKKPEESRGREQRDDGETVQTPQTRRLNPDAAENCDSLRFSDALTPDSVETETTNAAPEPARKPVSSERSGRLQFERESESEKPEAEPSKYPAARMENRERLRFDDMREVSATPDERIERPVAKPRQKTQQGPETRTVNVSPEKREPENAAASPQRPFGRLEDRERLRFDDTREVPPTPDERVDNPAAKSRQESRRKPVNRAVNASLNRAVNTSPEKHEPEKTTASPQRPTSRLDNRERLRFENTQETTFLPDTRNRTAVPQRRQALRLPPPSNDTSETRLRFETGSSQTAASKADSAAWPPETADETLYAVIDGQRVPVEVVDATPEPEKDFRQKRTGRQNAKSSNSGGNRASGFSSDSAGAEKTRLHFESDTQTPQTDTPLWDAEVVEDLNGVHKYSTSFEQIQANAIDVEFYPVDPPMQSEEPESKYKKHPEKKGKQRPPANRMEDGARLRVDADWNTDSGSQAKKRKPEKAEKKKPFRWKRDREKPQTTPQNRKPQTAETTGAVEKNDSYSRLHFEDKPPKLTDESQRQRKGPRLKFGIGKNVKTADSGKITTETEPPESDAKTVPADRKGLSRRIGQRQKVREAGQERKPQSNADRAIKGEPRQEPDTPELFTRTRRKQPVKSADDTHDGTAGKPDERKKRQRLQFEPEPCQTDDPETEGYTRKPPKQNAEEREEKPGAEPKKPRLRFEKEPSRETDAPSDEQAEKASNAATTALPKPLTREEKQAAKAEKRVEKANRRLEKAQSKIPVKRRIKLAKQYDESTGKVKRRLQFEKEPIPEGVSSLPLPLRGIGGAANSARVTLLLKGHQKIRETERQNVGVEAGHKGEIVAEQAVGGFLRWNHRRLRTKPYRAVRQTERALEREQVNLEWRRMVRNHPELQRKHALAKWVQKQRLKRKYAAAAREAKKTEQHTQTVLNETGQIIRAAAQYIAAKKSVLATVALLGLIVLLFSAGLTSCMAMLSSFQSSYISVSYMANEEDICEADLYYSEMETDLQIDIDETEINHPGYDEYRYRIGEIAHSPFQLLSYLSTKYNAFQFRRIKTDIEALFWEQYTLTRTVIVETRYDSDDEPYDWYVLVTTLTVRPLSNLISEKLDAGEETTRYGLYMQTYGNRQAYGNPFDFAWLGRISSLYGYRKHPMTGAKNLHRGVDIGAPLGTEIHAIQDGRVVSAGENGSYGLCVVIEDEKGYSSLYAHCSRLDVHAGERVKRGDVIAAVGSTGSSTGPHLHLETKLDGEYLNPLFFVETGGGSAGPGGEGGVVYPGYPGEPPTDETYARMLEEAEKYLGYPYVWGGSSPATSFDCSGFVSWVINHSGWNVGRLGAQALCNLCTPVSPADARPGDLVFFRYTYNAPIPDGVTHCGIYVGNNQMIHCGNPISYTDLTSSYWQAHFFTFGRLPTP